MDDKVSVIHQAAAEGYTVAADSYVRGRPDYSPAVADWLRDDIGLRAGATVVDLGAGTGKFTPRLVETEARVIAVEPVAQMREKLHAAVPQAEALAGTADAIPLPDASVDAVVCAQSFHWFATPEALHEIHRVLKPVGKLGLIWNVRDARVGWIARLDRIVNSIEGETPRYHSGAWRTVFPFPGFSPLYERHFAVAHVGTPDDVIVHRVLSTSFIATLPESEQTKIIAQVKELIASEPKLQGKETVTVPYETAAFYTVKES